MSRAVLPVFHPWKRPASAPARALSAMPAASRAIPTGLRGQAPIFRSPLCLAVARLRTLAALALILLVLGLNSCAPHMADMSLVREEMARGDYASAHGLLEEGDEDDVLHLMEKGLLSHYAGLFDESNQAFERAEVLSEDLYTKSLSREAAALLTSDLILSYSGSDMERMMIGFYRALNYLNLGLPEDVLVECRKISEKLAFHRAEHEDGRSYYDDAYLQYITGVLYEWGGDLNDAFISYREADRLYPQFSKQYGIVPPPTLQCDIERTATALGLSPWESKEAATPGPREAVIPESEKGASPSWKESVTQESQEDTAPDLEEGGTLSRVERRAPSSDNNKVDEEGISGEEEITGADDTSGEVDALRRKEKPCVYHPGHGDVVLVLELGFVAHKDEVVLHIPIFDDETSLAEAHDDDFFMTLSDRAAGYDEGDREIAYILSVAVPRCVRTEPIARLGLLNVGQMRIETVKTQDLSAITIRSLNERMPRVLAKTAARAVTKYVAKKGAEKKWGKLSGALLDVFGSATEHADTRSWLSLPSEIHLARLSLPEGTYQASLELLGLSGSPVESVDFGDIEVSEGDVTFLHHRAP